MSETFTFHDQESNLPLQNGAPDWGYYFGIFTAGALVAVNYATLNVSGRLGAESSEAMHDCRVRGSRSSFVMALHDLSSLS